MAHIFRVFSWAILLMAFMAVFAFSGSHGGGSSGGSGLLGFVTILMVVPILVLLVLMIFKSARGEYSTSRMPPGSSIIEEELYRLMKRTTDKSGKDSMQRLQRYAQTIGLIGEGEQLPPHFKDVISYRLLFGYFEKFGNLKARLFAGTHITLEQALAPLSEDQKARFEQFCRTTLNPDYHRELEIAKIQGRTLV